MHGLGLWSLAKSLKVAPLRPSCGNSCAQPPEANRVSPSQLMSPLLSDSLSDGQSLTHTVGQVAARGLGLLNGVTKFVCNVTEPLGRCDCSLPVQPPGGSVTLRNRGPLAESALPVVNSSRVALPPYQGARKSTQYLEPGASSSTVALLLGWLIFQFIFTWNPSWLNRTRQ